MPETENPPNTALENSLEGAFAGRRDAIELFFKAIITGYLYIPERFQAYPLSDSPPYPNDFLNLLGIQDSERVIVPAFSDPELIEEWCGSPLTYKRLRGPDAAAMLPEEWWMIVNPGSEILRELTPWEIARIKEGEQGLTELLHEAFSDIAADPIRIRPLEEEEFADATAALQRYCAEHEAVQNLYMLVEEGETADGSQSLTLMVGIALDDSVPPADYAAIQDTVDAHVAPALIGGQQKKIFVGTDTSASVMLGLFKGAEPVFSRSGENGSVFSRLKKLISK